MYSTKRLCSAVMVLLWAILTFPLPSFSQSQDTDLADVERREMDSILAAVDALSNYDEKIALIISEKNKLPIKNPLWEGLTYRLIDESLQQRDDHHAIRNTAAFVTHLVNTFRMEEADSLIRITNHLYPFKSDLDPFSRMRYWNARGYYQERKGWFDSARHYLNLAADAFDPSGATYKEASIYGDMISNKAQAEYSTGKFGEASQSLNIAKEVFLSIGDSIGVGITLQEFSVLYSMLGLFDEAERYLLEKRNYVEMTPFDDMAESLNLGRNHIIEREYDKAITRYNTGLDLIREIDGPNASMMRLYGYNGLIEANYFAGDHDSLTTYYQKLEKAFDDIGRDEESFGFMVKQSQFLNLLSQRNFEAAEPVGKQLYADARTANDPAEIMLHASFLDELYRAKGEFKNALQYADVSNNIRDSLNTANKTGALILYQTQLETAEKEKRIGELASEKKLASARGQLYGTAAILMAGLLLIGTYLYRKLGIARKQLVVQNTELEALNNTKDRFFGIIGHDLRSPLVALDGVDEQLKFYAEKGDMNKLQRVSGMVGSTAKQLTALLDNLLSWAMTQAGTVPYHPESIPVTEAVGEIINLLQPNAALKKIEVKTSIEGEPLVKADRNALSSVLRNLVSNAIKHSSSGDTVEVKASQQNGQVSIEVVDQGIGIPKEQVEKLFSLEAKNTRGTAGEKGTGLGLILCQDFVVQNKGSISVKSEEGKGSTFTVALPSA